MLRDSLSRNDRRVIDLPARESRDSALVLPTDVDDGITQSDPFEGFEISIFNSLSIFMPTDMAVPEAHEKRRLAHAILANAVRVICFSSSSGAMAEMGRFWSWRSKTMGS